MFTNVNDKKKLVYWGTDIEYEDTLPDQQDWQNITYQNGHLKTFQLPNSTALEYIADSTFRDRQRILVYAGTGIKYQNTLPDKKYWQNITYKNGANGLIKTFQLPDNTTLEYITSAVFRHRQSILVVYAGTDIKYQGILPDKKNWQNITYRHGLIKTFQLPDNTTLEYVTSAMFRERQSVLVYAGTDIKYQNILPDKKYWRNITYKNGLIKTFQLPDNTKLEYVTNNTFRHRQNVLVYVGTGIKYQNILPDKKYWRNITYKHGLIKTFQLPDNTTLEYITDAMFRHRQSVLVYANTRIKYANTLSAQKDWQKITYENGQIKTFQLPDNTTLEYITDTTFKNRRSVLVYAGTGIEYQGILPDKKDWQKITYQNGQIKTLQLPDKTILEYITAAAFRYRRNILENNTNNRNNQHNKYKRKFKICEDDDPNSFNSKKNKSFITRNSAGNPYNFFNYSKHDISNEIKPVDNLGCEKLNPSLLFNSDDRCQ